MKIDFPDKSYLECKKSEDGKMVIITISARDRADSLKKVNNSVEITIEEFKRLVSEISA